MCLATHFRTPILAALAATLISSFFLLPSSFAANATLLNMSVSYAKNDVRYWGAVGDGVHDDLPAFNATRDSLGGSPGVIVAKQGTFLLGGTFYLTNEFQTLLDDDSLVSGYGGGTCSDATLIWNSGTIGISTFSGTNNTHYVAIKGFNVNGNGVLSDGVSFGGLNSKLENCTIVNCKNAAINLHGLIQNEIIADNNLSLNGFGILATNTQNLAAGVYNGLSKFSGNAIRRNGYGVWALSAGPWSFDHNIFESNTNTGCVFSNSFVSFGKLDYFENNERATGYQIRATNSTIIFDAVSFNSIGDTKAINCVNTLTTFAGCSEVGVPGATAYDSDTNSICIGSFDQVGYTYPVPAKTTRLSQDGSAAVASLTATTNINCAATNTARQFVGGGSGLTSLQDTNITGTIKVTNGKVGIGTTTPGATLEVNGGASIDGPVSSTLAAPGIAAGTGAGSSPTLVSSLGSQQSGIITLTTGSGPGASAVIATLTYAASWPWQTTNYTALTPGNAAASALMATGAYPYVTWTSNTFILNSTSVALTGGTTYQFGWK
ncbi:MAG TPA: hypothetical protein VFC44_26890 [Candidatus Saccharimonadales bacterium]|nr:hypothetical protein [Candidatus Saccharimonadales bacterium]